jgi:hypothetical protein
MKKIFTITLLFIMFSNSLTIHSELVFAGSSISKPTTPEFTLQFVDKSFDVPPTFSKDPFTGETAITKEGYHVDNRSIEVKIKNQPFTPYTDPQGNFVHLCYDIRWKGHFDDYWDTRSDGYGNNYCTADYEANSDGSWRANVPYTTMTYVVGTNREDGKFVYGYNLPLLGDVSEGGQIDFQVQAFIGYYTSVEDPPDVFNYRRTEHLVFTGESSGWSKTKTATIETGNKGEIQKPSQPNQNPDTPPNPSGSLPEKKFAELSLTEGTLLTILVIVTILLIVITFHYRKKIATNLPNNHL